ncbi:MAG: TatD family hydrolase [Bacteroidota bacterium]
MKHLMIDTHAHIYLDQFKKDRQEVIERSIEAGVSQICLPNIDRESIDGMLELQEKYPENCFAMMGLHPCSVKKDFEKELYWVEEWLDKAPFIAVGEIGTDLYWDKSFFEQQKEAFKIQVALAKKHDLPIVIHCRESMRETLDLIKPLKDEKLRGIFHCFGGSVAEAEEIIELGFLMGIGGVSTFKKAAMDQVLPHIDLKYLVLETDSPYLAPKPYRGKRNEPAYVAIIAQRIAEIKGIEKDEVARVTTENARQLFKLPSFQEL